MHNVLEILSQNFLLLLFSTYCALIGFSLNTRLKLWQGSPVAKNNFYLRLFFALSSGLMINITLLFFLGIMGFLTSYAIFSGAFLLFSLAIFSPKDLYLKKPFLLESLVILLFFLFIVSMAIRAPGSWDDTLYHLPLARFYAQNHAIILNEYLRFPLFPQNIDLLFVLGLIIGDETVAQGMATFPLFITGIGLIGTCIWLLNSKVLGYLSVLALFILAPIKNAFGYAYVDQGLALFSWGALLAIAIWTSTEPRSKNWLFIAGMLAGGAVGSKFFGAPLATFLGLYLLLIVRNWRATLVYGITVLVFGSWWYIRSAIISGDPFSPAGGNIFGYFLWDAQDLFLQKQEQGTFGVNKNIFYLGQALIKAGMSLWILAFLSFIFSKKEKEVIRFFQIIFLAYFLCWFFVTQVPRYLSPIFAVGTFLSIFFLYKIFLCRFIPAITTRCARFNNPYLVSLPFLLLLSIVSIFSYASAFKHLKNWDATLANRPGYLLFQKANTLIPSFGPHLIQIGFENGIYFFNGTVIGDHFGLGRYRNMIEANQLIPSADMLALMSRFDSRMLLVNTKAIRIDIADYQTYFRVIQKTDDGLLFAKK